MNEFNPTSEVYNIGNGAFQNFLFANSLFANGSFPKVVTVAYGLRNFGCIPWKWFPLNNYTTKTVNAAHAKLD